jgi:hypothetical protein
MDSQQLRMSVFSGVIKLENLTLKHTLFDQSPLPFKLDYGRVGLIYVKIPFWDMFKSPLEIRIENIFGFVKFKEWAEWD